MLLMYVGERDIDLIPNSVYEVKKFHDDFLGDGYAIFDEGDDWYWYSVEFVKENFVEFEEKKFCSVRPMT